MVVPHCIGDPVRTFVRVPSSGIEKSAKPVLCDLGRTSTLAATISVPQNLPSSTNVLFQTPSVTPIPNSQQRKRPRPEEKENSPDSSSAPKVIRIMTSSATAIDSIKRYKTLLESEYVRINGKYHNMIIVNNSNYGLLGSASAGVLKGKNVAAAATMLGRKYIKETAKYGHQITLLAAVRIPNAEVQKLKEENEQLRKENELLKKQLSLFKQLIRNPQRLNSVLRRLEEKSQEA